MSRSGPTADRRRKIALCRWCRREILPSGIKGSALRKDAHRAASEGMVEERKPDPAAERKRQAKERKSARKKTGAQSLALAAIRSRNLHERATLVLELRGFTPILADPVDDECERCLKMQRIA